jgi:hypothetical protein
MRSPRFRFNARQFAEIVAVCSVTFALLHWTDLRDEYRRHAERHEAALRDLDTIQNDGFYAYCSRDGSTMIHLKYDTATAELQAHLVRYHDEMRRKYRRAMRRPWYPPLPDPPAPE